MDFWLGTHRPNWLERTDVPLMVSHRTLGGQRRLPKELRDRARSLTPAELATVMSRHGVWVPRKRLPKALGPWALDSGGFTELSMNGRWTTTLHEYVAAVRRYVSEVGNLVWAAPQDWMCEPFMLERTGMSVLEHQVRTVVNVALLHAQAPDLPIIPVLQGWELPDYLHCIRLYDEAGVSLDGLVGVGSVCRRQDMDEASHIMRALAAEGLQLHGFGFKLTGIRRCQDVLASADSMAWSLDGRYGARSPQCDHKGACGNCLTYALRWREQVVRIFDQLPLETA